MSTEKKQTLYMIDGDIKNIEDNLWITGGEITDEIQKKLDALQGDRTGKIDRIMQHRQNYLAKVTRLTAEAEVFTAEAKRILQRAKVAKNTAEGLKDYVFESMKKNIEDTLDTEHFLLTVKTTAAKVTDIPEDISKFPRHFISQPDAKPDKKALLDAWKIDPGSIPKGVKIETGKTLKVT